MVRSILYTLALVSASLAFGEQTSVAQDSAGSTIAVVDINYIFENHLRFKQAMDDIKNDIASFDAYIRDERTKFTAKAQQLNTFPANSTQYKQLEEELANQQTQLQLEMNRKRKEILDREARVFYNAYREIQKHVTDFANRYSIDLVLRFNGAEMDPSKRDSVLQGINRAVVFQRSLNITTQILDVLNAGTPPAPRVGGVDGSGQVPVRRN